jgi:hypothetical protein
MNDYRTKTPLTVIEGLRKVDDAGVVHYEGVFSGAWFANHEDEGVLRLENNIRPDWNPNGKVGAKTRRKVDRWTEELLKNNAVMGNLSIRLDPDKSEYNVAPDEDGDYTLTLYEGNFDTGVDSQSRITAILQAVRNPLGTFKAGTRFATRIWIADDELASRVGSDYNTRGDKVNDTAAKYAYQDNYLKKLARHLLERSPHLGIDNVEVLKNTVSASSSKLVAFNTLTQAMETFWSSDPVNDTDLSAQTDYLVDFWNKLVKIRPEFGRLGKADRQALRGSSMAGTALSIHGVVAVADAAYTARIDVASALAHLGEDIYVDGRAVDYFAYDNPTWLRIGALVTTEDKDGNERKSIRMSFQSRKAVANELKHKTGLL